MIYLYKYVKIDIGNNVLGRDFMSKKEIVKKIFHMICLLLLSICLISSFYLKKEYADESIEELFFYLTSGVGNSDLSIFLVATKKCIFFVAMVTFILYMLMYDVSFVKNKNIFKITKEHRIISTLIVFIVFFGISLNNIDALTYLKVNLSSSNFIKDNYKVGEVRLPDAGKRNLITIYVESLETTLFTKKQGGEWNYEVIPELYDLLNDEDSIYFSSDDKSAGEYNLYGTTWTTASIVANSTGLPFKIPIKQNDYHSSNFMNGAYSIGDILKENGYNNEVISAAKTSFGGIKEFYTNHGDYNIIDYDSIVDSGKKISKKDQGGWGFNDNYMFKVAKERIIKLSKEDKPFNETIIGIDTHFPNGYKGYYTLNKYKTQYENVYATESKLVYNFVSWVKKQDFYKDTVIVIIGDHTSMNSDYFSNYKAGKRKRYNVIINSSVTTDNTKNRVFTAIDMAPTILSSIGAYIENDQLGLGINLFSDKKTLSEKYGFKNMNLELGKKSDFYNEKILGSDYNKMINKKE